MIDTLIWQKNLSHFALIQFIDDSLVAYFLDHPVYSG